MRLPMKGLGRELRLGLRYLAIPFVQALAAALSLALFVVLALGCGGGKGGGTIGVPSAASAPTITAQPTNQTALYGGATTFTVTATASPAPEYQWRKNGHQIMGATGASLQLSGLQLLDDGATFDVIVHNEIGNVTSAPATLHVQNIPGHFLVRFFTTKAGALSGTTIQSIAPGGAATPMAVSARNGAYFTHWTGPNGFTSTDNPLVLSDVQSDMDLTAHYSGYTVGCTATEVTGLDGNGTAVALSEDRGSVILLDVSAGWCSYCQSDAPLAEALYQKYKAQGLKAVTVLSMDSNWAIPDQGTLQAWTTSYGLTHKVMSDTTGWDAFSGVSYTIYSAGAGYNLPAYVLIDKSFTIQYIQAGYDEAALEAKIQALLAQ